MNFNPAMYEQFKNMDPNMLKNMSDMMGKMSDEDLKNYSKMAGMPQVSPEMLRNSANMMKNMDANQLNQMKDMAGRMGPGGMPGMPGMGAYPSTTPGSTPTNTSKPTTQPQSTGQFPKIEKLKNDGNEYFKKGKYDDASAAYFEAILEIEELKMRKDFKNSELDQLEISCRLNYCNVKAKLNDFEIVLNQAKQVVKIQENNAKALFRLGQAYFHLKKYELALSNLQESYKSLNTDQTVIEYIGKAKERLAELNVKSTAEQKSTETKSQEDITTQKSENISTNKSESTGASKIKKKKEAPNPDDDLVKEIMNKKNEKAYEAEKSNSNANNHHHHTHTERCNHNHPDVKIEEEKYPTQTSSSISTSTAKPVVDEKLLKGHEELKTMSPDQMRMMTEYLKSMDNSFIKQMLKSQTGMEMSDSDIENFKRMMTPETLETFAKMDPTMLQSMKGFGAPGQPSSTITSSSQPNQATASTVTQSVPSFPAQPNLNAMGGLGGIGSMLSSDAMANMVDMMAKNPQMLQGMVGMLGEKHPLASMLKDKKPEDLAKIMGYLSKFMKVASKASPVFIFIKNYWKYMLGLLIAYVVYQYI